MTVGNKNTQKRGDKTWWTRMNRSMRYRLLIPLQRSIHPPEYTARGVSVGLAWGLTPTVGVQMIFVFLVWVAGRRLFKWDFSLIIAWAWTWTTNVITLLPCYYLFYMTGQVMLGRFDDMTGYSEFMKHWDSQVGDDAALTLWDSVWARTVMLLKGWGLPMLIGCVPWAVLGAWVGYYWSLGFLRRYRSSRERRRAQRIAVLAGTTQTKT